MEFRLLGPLEIRSETGPVEVREGRERALLALLLLHANEPVSADRLVEELWNGRPPPSAPKILQGYVSRLRRLLAAEPPSRILTRARGYELRTEPDEVDLLRFESLLEASRRATDPTRRADLAREALSLFRGEPLADFRGEPFAEPAIAQVEDLRITAFEERVEADLAVGRHAGLVAELTELARKHPLRERLVGQLMLALYRCGRQAEALAVYQELRHRLTDELGLEPGPALKGLQRRILTQDPTLELEPGNGAAPQSAAPERSVFVVVVDDSSLSGLVAVTEPLGRGGRPRELVLTRLFAEAGDGKISNALEALRRQRSELAERGVTARVAAFTSRSVSEHVSKLAARPEADLLVLPLEREVMRDGDLPPAIAHVLATAPCDVALWLGRADQETLPSSREGAVLVPFGGGDHDWAALELGARLAEAGDRPLRLIGVAFDVEDPERGDASELLADAGLLVQRVVGVVPEVALVAAGYEGVAAAAEDDADLLVAGLSDRWRSEGLGLERWALARRTCASLLYVRRGLQPSRFAADGRETRYRWSTA